VVKTPPLTPPRKRGGGQERKIVQWLKPRKRGGGQERSGVMFRNQGDKVSCQKLNPVMYKYCPLVQIP
jgi:hypothetical protein